MHSDLSQRIKFLFISAGIFFIFAAIADHVVLPYFVRDQAGDGLLFPPGSEFPYQTPEFTHMAKINSLGFRDRQWEIPKKKSTTRIIAIGDSFTFGMGVELEQTWTKMLEQRLQDLGFDVEIANLGRPGADPASYAEVARKAIPLLKPDIVLVAILQGDDLAQTITEVKSEQTVTNAARLSRFGLPFKRAVRYLYPHCYRIIQEQLANRSTFRSKERLLENIWKDQAARLVAGYTGERKARFDSMKAPAKEMFMKGHLNPGIVSMAIADPDYFTTPLLTEDSLVKSALWKMREHLQNIKKNAGDAKVIVLSIPLGLYVSENVRQAGHEIGFTTVPEMLLTTKPDESLKKICDEAGITFLSVTDAFRRQSREQPLYYRYDGHFNARGHELFADQLLSRIRQQLVAQQDRN